MSGWKFLRSKKSRPDQAASLPAAPAEQTGVMEQASRLGNQAMQQYASPVAQSGGQSLPIFGEFVDQRSANTGRVETPEENARDMEELQNAPAMTRTGLAELYTELRNSKKGGLFKKENSQYYNDVISSLNRLNTAMSKNFSNDVTANHKNLVEMNEHYNQLIAACEAYTSRDAKTSAGAHRKELVKQIQTRASSDLVALSAVQTDFCSLTPEQQSQKSWNELLNQSRTIHLKAKDFYAIGKATGGQASEVYKLSGSDIQVKSAGDQDVALADVHYFKPEDEIDMSKSSTAEKIVANAMKRFPKLTKKDKQLISKWAATANKTDANISQNFNGLSEEGKLAMTSINSQLSGVSTTVSALLPHMKIGNNDEKINMTKRNVATSRVAAMLGLDGLVAKSETAEIFDEATGTSIRGNLMQKARGEDSGLNYAEKSKAGKTVNYSLNAEIPDITVNATGKFQRDMCNLQVLDVICGQLDRHSGNYMVSANKGGELSDVQGIDNDGAFGLNEHSDFYKASGNNRSIYNIQTGEWTMAYMDKNLAERVKALDPEMMRYALKDLIGDDEINAAITRLNNVKKALSTIDENRLLEDDEWNDDTAQALIDQAWDTHREFRKAKDNKNLSQEEQMNVMENSMLNSNYFGEMMLKTMPFPDWNWGIGANPQLLRRKNRNQGK